MVSGQVLGLIDLFNFSLYAGVNSSILSINNPTPNENNEQYRVLVGKLDYVCIDSISNTVTLTVHVNMVISNRRITYRVNRN